MSSSGNVRLTRPIEPPQKTKKHSKIVTLLLSCCLFEAVLSACLLGALILVGRYYLQNQDNVLTSNSGHPTLSNISELINHKIIRLPRDVIPIHYDITLQPNLEDGEVTGRVNITIKVLKMRNSIILNSLNLGINQVKLLRAHNGGIIPITSITPRKPEETLEIVPQNALKQGRYYLVIEYSGQIRDKIVGLYQSSYMNIEKGQR